MVVVFLQDIQGNFERIGKRLPFDDPCYQCSENTGRKITRWMAVGDFGRSATGIEYRPSVRLAGKE